MTEGKISVTSPFIIHRENPTVIARVHIMDLELTPIAAHVSGRGEQSVSPTLFLARDSPTS